jgi:glycosyltransferase involved in cell wall biosynthesis/SAM-dependent methyltransferase
MLNNQTQSYFSQSNLWTEQIALYQEQVLADILAILPSDVVSILDVGCGNGLITNKLPESLEVVGLDRSEEALKNVQKETIVGDILNLPLKNQSFDLVICNDVLEHLRTEEREQALKELARVSRKYILITVPFLEDLNQGMTKCGNCGKYYHINHHLFSFDLDTTSKFFQNSNYYCIKQVLSGDIWYGEPPEIVLARRLLLDLPLYESPVCLHCGSSKIAKSQDSSDVVSPLIAKLSLDNPSLRDWHIRRTECISLFSNEIETKHDFSGNQTEIFIDKKNNQIDLDSENLSTNKIIFRKKELYCHTFLPKISRLPYYYTNHDCISEDGIKLIDKQSLLIGFFGKPNQDKISLVFSGFAEKDSSLVVTKYDDLQGYTLPVINQVSDQFSVSLEFPASLSSYGFLFEISILKGTVNITEALLENISVEEVTVYENKDKRARFWRTKSIQQNIVDISLPIYREFIIGQDLESQVQAKIINSIVSSYYLEHLDYLENTGIGNCLSMLFGEIKDKDRLKISTKTDNQQLKTDNQQLKTDNQQLKTDNQQLKTDNQQLKTDNQQLKTDNQQRLSMKIKRKIMSFGKAKYLSEQEFKNQILNSIEPNLVDPQWAKLQKESKLFLMICHDQSIDRRIIQQALTLLEDGWQGKIICLSFDAEDHLEEFEGISIHRIGLAKVVPDCPVYWRYQNRQRLINWWGRNFTILSKLNWLYYKIHSRLGYQGKHSGYPLPFDFVFYITAKHYQADLIIAHDLPALKAAHRLAKEWSIPLGYDAHELYYEQSVFSEKKKKLMRQVEQELIKECDIAFTVNLSIAEEMASRYHIKAPNVLLNAIDPPHDFNPEFTYKHLREYFQLPQDRLILLFQGGLERNRNLENLVQAMRYVTAPNLVLIFMGNGSLKETLENLVKKYNLTKKVFFKEAVPQNKLIYWTASADIGIIPYPHVDLNTYYCTPNKLFEFIQAQLPMIANDSPELRRFVHDTGFGKVGSMKNPQEIARLIDSFATNSITLKKAKENLSSNYHKFSWSYERINYLKQLKTLSLQ